MKNKIKLFNLKNLKLLLGLGLFIAIYVITHKNWYLSFNPITWGDTGFLYRDFYIDLLNTFSPIWNGGINFGANSAVTLNYFGYNFWGGLLARFGASYNVILRGIIFYPILISTIGSVLVMRRIYKDSIVPAVMFGLVVGINALVIVNWLNLLAAYTFLPIIFFALYKYLSGKKIIWLLIFSLLFTCSLVYEVRVGFVAFLFSIVFTIFYLLYYPMSKKVYIKKLIYVVISLVIVFLLNSFFIFPLLHRGGFSTITSITSQPLFGTGFYPLQYSLSLMQPYWNGTTFTVFLQQPLKFYFWFYPIFAFSALFFAKKDKKIIYFSLIAIFGIFMGKGANIPFGPVYSWLYSNLPFFNFFREPIQWWTITGFSYAVLIGYFFYYFYQEVDRQIKRKFSKSLFLNYFTKILIAAPIVFVTTTIVIPAYNGTLGRELNTVTFAKEYDLFRQFLLKDKNYYRVLNVPTSQRFMYYSNNHPYVAFGSIHDNFKSLNPKLLSLESVRYVAMPDDVLKEDFYLNNINKQEYEYYINSTQTTQGYAPLKMVSNIGNIKLWENTNDSPHLMAVKDLVYISGSQNISDLADIPTSKQVAYYLEQVIPQDSTKRVSDMITDTNGTMYKNATKIYSVASCVRCDFSKKYSDYVQFPFAKFLPNNILYPLIEAKDNKILNSITSPQARFEQEAFFAEKRTIETQTMIQQNNPIKYKKYIISTILKTNKLLDDMENSFNEMDSKSIDNGLLSTWDYLYTEKRTYDDLYQIGTDPQIEDMLSKLTYRLGDLLTKVSNKIWVTQDNKKRLVVNLAQEGKYKILIKNDDETNISDAQLVINGNVFQKTSSENGYLNYGNYEFDKGNYYLELDTPSVNLLDLSLPSDSIVQKSNINIISLKDSKSQYQLSFDYKVVGGRAPRLFISDDIFPSNSNVSSGNLILDTVLMNRDDGQWRHFNIFFTPNIGVKNPVLHLKGEDEGNETVYKNLLLTKVVSPMIVFVKDTGKVLDTPKITYQEITSTDYMLKIENAKQPFLLSFSEQFDGNWTTLNTGKQNFYGSSVIARYFDNNVEEIPYANRLESAVLMDSLTNNDNTNSLHVQLNGFSNGWIINKTGTYNLHLTFSSQKNFIIGVVVSALTLVSVVSLIIILFVKNIIKKT